MQVYGGGDKPQILALVLRTQRVQGQCGGDGQNLLIGFFTGMSAAALLQRSIWLIAARFFSKKTLNFYRETGFTKANILDIFRSFLFYFLESCENLALGVFFDVDREYDIIISIRDRDRSLPGNRKFC